MDGTYTLLPQQPDEQKVKEAPTKKSRSIGLLILGLLIWIAGGVYAGSLSWRCNTNHGFTTWAKVVSAIFSFLGSWCYCLTYLFYKSWTCDPKASLARLQAMPAPTIPHL